jgi:pyrroline-5-carboxylate reductase
VPYSDPARDERRQAAGGQGKNVKLGLIGCGFMGESVLRAALDRKVVRAADVRIAEASENRRAVIERTLGIVPKSDPGDAAEDTDLVIFAVKPQEFDEAAASVRGRTHPGQTVVSIMAGVRIDTIARATGHTAIVRVMPNTPAAIGEGMSAWMATPEVTEAGREQVRTLLAVLGKEVSVADEKYIDMATALSGSGPGFVYLLIEAFIDAGVQIGFRRDVAELLSLQTFLGSARYAAATGKHAAQLRNEVTSPAGTTAAGLLVLEQAGVRAAIAEAVEAAYARARELGG